MLAGRTERDQLASERAMILADNCGRHLSYRGVPASGQEVTPLV